MKWLFWTAASLISVVVLLSVIGVLMPRTQSFTRSVRIPDPPQTVWSVLTDCTAEPYWRPEVKSCQALPTEDGHPVFRLMSSHGGSTEVEVYETIPSQNLGVRFLNLPAGGQLSWIFNLTPFQGGTQVSLTQNDSIGDLPARIFFRASVRAQVADAFLRELAQDFKK